MKRTILILSIYAAIIFAACLCVTWAYRPLPPLNAGDASAYRFFRALHWFLNMLPSVFLSGFSVACAVLWQNGTSNSKQRFSVAMFTRYRQVVVGALIMVFILSLNHEVFLPRSQDRLAALKNGPLELAKAKETVLNLLDAGEPELAYPYAKRATLISRHDEEAADLLVRVQNAVDLARDQGIHGFKEASAPTLEQQERPLYTADTSYTVLELLQKSEQASEELDWFAAHYWAMLALRGCSETDPNYSVANQAANEAWGRLQFPAGFGNESELDYYHKKLAAYEALSAGNTSDNLRAYYLFLELSRYPGRTAVDPDVTRFLALAQEAVETDYFFIDETENMEEIENSHDIYFRLVDPRDDTQNVYYIEGALDTREDGRLVRYLEGLHVVTYSQEGKFIRMMHVPVAKVIAHPVSAVGAETLEIMGADASWKYIPFVMLQAVDRETRGRVLAPWYSYTESGLTEDVVERLGLTSVAAEEVPAYSVVDMAGGMGAAPGRTSRTMFLPMPFSDFAAVKDASAGPDKMDLFTLRSFLSRVTKYGFSYEVFSQNLVSRGVFPLFLLVLFLFAAALGWNYRIDPDDKARFKFRWLFLVPVYGSVMYLLLEVTNYVFIVTNYVLVGIFGGMALLASFMLFVVLFIAVSVNFLARQE